MYSFDIFDTLITRKTATPTGIFAVMQNKLQENYIENIDSYIKNNFYYLRINAERMAHFDKPTEEVTLEMIYSAIKTVGSISESQIEALMELEIQTEIDYSYPIVKNIELLKKLVYDGHKVILISDMYLDSSIIRKILLKHDEVFNDIPLYVSSDIGYCKHTGYLFDYVKLKENAAFNEWIHIGDNSKSDVLMPQKKGIEIQPYAFCELMPIEKNALEKDESDYFTQLNIGASRNARLTHDLDYSASVGSSIGGVLFYQYALWIVNECINKGIDRLYFIARDGYIPKKIIDIIIEKRNLSIKTFYIYGSRRAWRMAAFNENKCNVTELIKWSYPQRFIVLSHISDALEISLTDLCRYLPKHYTADRDLSFYDVQLITSMLDDNQEFKKYLINRNNENFKLVQNYIKQEIDLSDDNFAFVEIRGSGYTEECFAEFFNGIYNKPIRTFYYMLNGMQTVRNNIYYNFLPSYVENPVVIELLSNAPHNQTVGYVEKDNMIAPVFNSEYSVGSSEIYASYINGILDFASLYDCDEIKLSLSMEYINYLTKNPDTKLLDYICDMPFNEEGATAVSNVFAPKLSREDIYNIYAIDGGPIVKKNYTGSCFKYSLMRCSENDLCYIEKCKTKYERPVNHVKYAHGFPCDILHGKVVIYGAGKLGMQINKKIKYFNSCNVVAIVDKNHKNFSDEVSSIDLLSDLCYDFIVIAILNKIIAMDIKEFLILQGVPADKIIWIDLRSKKL